MPDEGDALQPPVPEWVNYIFGNATAVQVIFWVIATLAILTILRKIWPALSEVVQIVDAVTGLPTHIKKTDEMMERLRHQVENDHNTNLREELTEALELSRSTDKKADQMLAWQQLHIQESIDRDARIARLAVAISHGDIEETVGLVQSENSPARP